MTDGMMGQMTGSYFEGIGTPFEQPGGIVLLWPWIPFQLTCSNTP